MIRPMEEFSAHSYPVTQAVAYLGSRFTRIGTRTVSGLQMKMQAQVKIPNVIPARHAESSVQP